MDIWRLRNTDKQQFTWHGRSQGKLIQSRLDFFLTSISLESEIDKVTISPSICTDHSLVSLCLRIPDSQKRGNSFWKFNNSLLKNSEYILLIKSVIKDIVAENPISNKSTLWEYVKCQIRTETLAYSSRKAKIRKNTENQILNKLENLEVQLHLCNDVHIQNEYDKLKQEYEDIQAEKSKGIILRSKAKYVEDGEKSTKFFLNLEKRSYDS